MISEGDLIDIQDTSLEYFDISAMSLSDKAALKKKFKSELANVRFAIGNIRTEEKNSLAQKHRPIEEEHMAISGTGCSAGNPQALTGKKRKLPEIVKQQKTEAASSILDACKKTLGRLDDQIGKGQKMDTNKARHCMTILKKLMTHKSGWVFNQPVDPVKLSIPDYFTIISRPMDLGTIKNKLESKLYSRTHQFAADVWLTFANAMQYNPPGNPVHNMAKELNDIFSSKWKELEVNWRKECSVQQPVVKKIQKQVITTKETSRKSLTSAEKLKLRKDLAKLPAGDLPPPLLNFLRKACSLGKNEDILDLDFDVLDDNTLWDLRQIVIRCSGARYAKSAEVGRRCSQASVKSSCTGGGRNMLRYGCVKDKAVTSRSDFTQSSSSDVDSERSSVYVRNSGASSQEYKTATTGSHRGTLNFDVDGEPVFAGSAVVIDGEHAQYSSHPESPAVPFGSGLPSTIGEDDPPCEQQLSPSKALRAALLKSRFADTIFKANNKTLLNHGEKGDPARMQREREKLERKHQEEKARIEAELEAAKAAAQMRAETKLKMQREKEREAARLALQKMEQTVHIDENSRVLKDLEDLAYARAGLHPDEMVVNYVDGLELQSSHGNPLEQLGLFIREEDLDEDDWLETQSGHVNPLEQLGLFVKNENSNKEGEAEDWLSPEGNGDVEEGEIP